MGVVGCIRSHGQRLGHLCSRAPFATIPCKEQKEPCPCWGQPLGVCYFTLLKK